MNGLKAAIEFTMPTGEKKSKSKQYHHAKDNAVSALGKIIKHQSHTINPNEIIPNWLSLLPLKHDLEESKI